MGGGGGAGGGVVYSANSNRTFAKLSKSAKFSLGGGGVGILPTQTQSPIISDNFHFWGEGRWGWGYSVPGSIL